MIKELINYFFGRTPVKKPSHGQISSNKLKDLIPLVGGRFYLSPVDLVYDLPEVQEIKDFLRTDDTNFQKFVNRVNDCDNFAIQLAGRLNRNFPGFAVGYAQSDTHAFNIFIDNNLKVYVIEPQTDKIYSIDEIKSNIKYFPFRMILI